MNLRNLIQQLQAIEKEHGPDVEVVARRFGDYLQDHPQVHVEKAVTYPWAGEEVWLPKEEFWLHGDEPLREATVVYIEH